MRALYDYLYIYIYIYKLWSFLYDYKCLTLLIWSYICLNLFTWLCMRFEICSMIKYDVLKFVIWLYTSFEAFYMTIYEFICLFLRKIVITRRSWQLRSSYFTCKGLLTCWVRFWYTLISKSTKTTCVWVIFQLFNVGQYLSHLGMLYVIRYTFNDP